VQETLAREESSPPNVGVDVNTTDQFVPFQVSAKPLGSPAVSVYVPTATQSRELRQETPVRSFMLLLGFGLETTDQTAPFHDSVKVVAPPTLVPTPMQKDTLAHDTALSWPPRDVAAPAGVAGPASTAATGTVIATARAAARPILLIPRIDAALIFRLTSTPAIQPPR
jgi:hypothetical protein